YATNAGLWSNRDQNCVRWTTQIWSLSPALGLGHTHTSHMYCNIRLNEHFRVSDSSKKIASRYVIIAYHWLIFSELMTHIFLHLQQQFDYSDIKACLHEGAAMADRLRF
ncbi:MAG: hypothetical protein MJA29_05565, partial [Candidatus Omnitrophica bacterium]|nr:hypothetical protein [Candidatus Omnitrophota bacterium]